MYLYKVILEDLYFSDYNKPETWGKFTPEVS